MTVIGRFRWRRPLVVALLLWLVAGLALAVTIGLQQRADSRRKGQLVVESMRKEVAGLPLIAFDASPGYGLTPGQVKVELERAKRGLDDLARLAGLENDH